jgi:hypothetical protein
MIAFVFFDEGGKSEQRLCNIADNIRLPTIYPKSGYGLVPQRLYYPAVVLEKGEKPYLSRDPHFMGGGKPYVLQSGMGDLGIGNICPPGCPLLHFNGNIGRR